jgi:hypothetical protein
MNRSSVSHLLCDSAIPAILQIRHRCGATRVELIEALAAAAQPVGARNGELVCCRRCWLPRLAPAYAGPLRTLYCANRRAYTDAVFFLVKERFLVFTHTVSIPFIDGSTIVLNAPGGGASYSCP